MLCCYSTAGRGAEYHDEHVCVCVSVCVCVCLWLRAYLCNYTSIFLWMFLPLWLGAALAALWLMLRASGFIDGIMLAHNGQKVAMWRSVYSLWLDRVQHGFDTTAYTRQAQQWTTGRIWYHVCFVNIVGRQHQIRCWKDKRYWQRKWWWRREKGSGKVTRRYFGKALICTFFCC